MTSSPAAPPHQNGGGPSSSQIGRLANIAVGLIAVAALVVGIIALVRSGSSADAGRSTETTPTYTAAEISEATQGVCDAWALADEAARRALNSPPADQDVPTQRLNARAALANAAGLLDVAASSAPAAKPDVVTAARALAEAYRMRVAVGMIGSDDARFSFVLRNTESAQARMKEVCDGG